MNQINNVMNHHSIRIMPITNSHHSTLNLINKATRTTIIIKGIMNIGLPPVIGTGYITIRDRGKQELKEIKNESKKNKFRKDYALTGVFGR